jgi:PilZ domain
MMQKERLGDRRSDLRFEIIGQLWGSLETVEPLPLRNVSRGGALVESRLPLLADSVQGVRLVFQGRASDLQARVRHVTPIVDPEGGERFLIGFEFVAIGEEALARIDHLVAVSSGRGPNSVEA